MNKIFLHILYKKKYYRTCINLLLISILAVNCNTSTNKTINAFSKASWITSPTLNDDEFSVYHFRKPFDLKKLPDECIIHVSADNRYKLYVNNQLVSTGPSKGDIEQWRYESLDISDYLTIGTNVIGAIVWNYGEHLPVSQLTLKTGFILCTNGKLASKINSNPSWKVIKNNACEPIPVDLTIIESFYAAGPGEKVNGSLYPYGWLENNYDDSKWLIPDIIPETEALWKLVPRTIPLMENKPQRFKSIRRAREIEMVSDFLLGNSEFIIPSKTEASLLLDMKYLTTGYPVLISSDGEGSEIIITYSESLVDSKGNKGQRNIIRNKGISGIFDIYQPDGGNNRVFSPLWKKTFRYVELDIKTSKDPLKLKDIYIDQSGYSFKERGYFKSNDKILSKIWETGWRTSMLCADETYYNSPYYEQIQYIGDSRIQALVSLYTSGDDRLMKKAIEQFHQSFIGEGIPQGRYPSHDVKIIPPFSLNWINMVYDYWLHRDDSTLVKHYIGSIDKILSWFESKIDENSMIGNLPYPSFIDRLSTNNEDFQLDTDYGSSSILTLQMIYSINQAIEIFNYFGKNELSRKYLALAEKLKLATLKHCWDIDKGLYSDSPEKKSYSQHANILAILAGAIHENEQKRFILNVAKDNSLIQISLYYRFFLVEALKKAGLSGSYLSFIDPWINMINQQLSTFAEEEEPTRADCYGWSSSINYHLLSVVAGISPKEPGFRSVYIRPAIADLEWIDASVPHPEGDIKLRINKQDNGKIWSEVELPPGVSGILFWEDKEIELSAGIQKLEF